MKTDSRATYYVISTYSLPSSAKKYTYALDYTITDVKLDTYIIYMMRRGRLIINAIYQTVSITTSSVMHTSNWLL
jgi:hypothetical protein